MLVKPARARASALFVATFGAAPDAGASAPGRVNLIGEHTDYNGGPVLPIAIAQRTCVMVGPGAPGLLDAVSERGAPARAIPYRDGRPAGWAAYLAGVLLALESMGIVPVGQGARIAVASDVPIGAGLSSSAALTVATTRAFLALARWQLGPREVADVAYRAEHDYVGVRVGIMDQTIAVRGRPGHALLLESATLAARNLPFG